MVSREPMYESRKAVQARILKITRSEFKGASEIAAALNLSRNTVRANYLYPMANSGFLRRKLPKGTRKGQAYKASGR
jgi:hypothetical protein